MAGPHSASPTQSFVKGRLYLINTIFLSLQTKKKIAKLKRSNQNHINGKICWGKKKAIPWQMLSPVTAIVINSNLRRQSRKDVFFS